MLRDDANLGRLLHHLTASALKRQRSLSLKPCHEDAPASVCKQWEQCCPRPATKPFRSSLLQHGERKGDEERAKTSKGQLRGKQEPLGLGHHVKKVS